jgi:hypothetical protein
MISKSLNQPMSCGKVRPMRCHGISRRKPAIAFIVVHLASLLGTSPSLHAERLTKETEQAFAQYVRASEARMDEDLAGRGGFLSVDALPQSSREQAYADLKNGHVLIQQFQRNDLAGALSVAGGLVHDWTGTVFIPGVSMSQVISVLQDYDHASQYYGPQVLKSKLLAHSGNDFHVFLRLKQVHVVTVVLDTEYDVHYLLLDENHAFSRSYSTRVAEVERAGEPQEREMPVGDDHGFLWRLYSYWRFYQSKGGVYIECNAISLTRSVPIGLGWLVRPFVETVPKDSLVFTLEATRESVVEQMHGSSSEKLLLWESNG